MLSQQFRVFLTVAECGSFSGAAKKLLVTPASVMKHMNALEARIGAALLIRTHRGVALTAAGRSLYEDGRKWKRWKKKPPPEPLRPTGGSSSAWVLLS